jgi:hypothetical protein
MSKTATTTIATTVSGDGLNAQQTVSNVNTSALPPSTVTTANGSVTVTVPAAAQGFTIYPPIGSVITKTLKGIAGDTGVPFGPGASFPASIGFAAGAIPSFVITANGIETLQVVWA